MTKSKIFTILIAAMLFGLSAGEGTAIADQPVGPSLAAAAEPSPILATQRIGPSRGVAVEPSPIFRPDGGYIRDLARGEEFTIICEFYDVTGRRFTDLLIDDVAGVSGRATVANDGKVQRVDRRDPWFLDDCGVLS
jgi:hypothetical protein